MWIRQQIKNFPIDPDCKNCPRVIFTIGVYGEILYPLSDLIEIGEFELDWARSKNNIAENSVALGHETHNNKSIVTKSDIAFSKI